MKIFYSVIALSVLTDHTWALPSVTKRDGPAQPTEPVADDATVLNYALELKNLQTTFYSEGLAKFDEQAFNQSGYPPSTRELYVAISQHEQIHAALINQTLNGTTTQPCTYNFSFTDVQSFVNVSQVIESTATSAYIGVLRNITNPIFLTVGASIAATEARHAAWIASAVTNNSAWDGPFDTPLTPRQVITLASPFIESCPSMPFMPFPPLIVSPGTPGSVVTFTFNASDNSPSNITNSTSGDDGSSTNGTTSDPNGTSNNSTTTVPTAPPESTEAPNSTLPDGSESTPEPSTPPDDGGDNSDPNTSPNLTVRQTSTPTPPGVIPPSNGTNGTNGTTPDVPSPPTNGTLFAAFLSGLDVQFSPIGSNGSVTLPSNLTGQVYAVVTTSNLVVTDDTIVAGPTVLVLGGMQGNATNGDTTDN